VLLPPAIEESTRWMDALTTFPFYGGRAPAVAGLALMWVAWAALAEAALSRRRHLLLAVMLSAPGTLSWSWTDYADYWQLPAHGYREHWTTVALLLPLVALAADRWWRRARPLSAERARPGPAGRPSAGTP
jgi:hypothetical protein